MRGFFLVLALALCAADVQAFAARMPQAGQTAPAFHLQDQRGHWLTLADFRRHWLVMSFYPKDFTPGCTTEVCTFRDAFVRLREAGADVIGISLDDVRSHGAFAKKYRVPFPLLSDADHKAAASYGVLRSVSGMPYARRTTFLIDPKGRVARIYIDVDPAKNARQVLSELAGLNAGPEARS